MNKTPFPEIEHKTRGQVALELPVLPVLVILLN